MKDLRKILILKLAGFKYFNQGRGNKQPAEEHNF